MSALVDFGAKALRSIDLPRLFRQLFGRIETKDERRRRLHAILQGVVTSLGNRVIGVVVSFVSVPLTIGYLGPERYGAWVTIGSLLAWLGLSDLGLGNGFSNAINTALGQGRTDLARTHVSNAIFLLSLPALVVALAFYFLWPAIDWSNFFGLASAQAKSEIGPATALALAIVLLQIPLSMTGRIYMALQEGRIVNYWNAAGNLLSLLALLVVTQTQGGLPWLVVAVSGMSLLLSCANTAWLYLVHKPQLAPAFRYVDFREMRSVAHVGGQFCLIQIMALVTFQTDNFFVGHFLGAANVPQYSLTYTLFNYTSLPQNIFFAYLWTAYNEAIARKDIAWVKKAFRLNLIGGGLFAIVASASLAYVAKPFLAWWGGPAAVPSTELVAWMAAWAVINPYCNALACLLAAASHLKAQIRYSALASLSNIVLSYILVQHWGIQGAIAATVISYLVFVCTPVYRDVNSLLQELDNAV